MNTPTPLRRPPSAQVAAWIRRLDECDADTPEARAVYREAIDAGQCNALADALQLGVAANRREAAELDAERQLLERFVATADDNMTFGAWLRANGATVTGRQA